MELKLTNIDESIIVDDDKKKLLKNFKKFRLSKKGLIIVNSKTEDGSNTTITIQSILFPEFKNKHLLQKNGNVLDWKKSNVILKNSLSKEEKDALKEKRNLNIEKLSLNIKR